MKTLLRRTQINQESGLKHNIGTKIPKMKTKGNTKVKANMPSKGSPEVVQVSPLLPSITHKHNRGE